MENIYDILEKIEKSPISYIKTESISLLGAFISGYVHGDWEMFHFNMKLPFLPFSWFNGWAANQVSKQPGVGGDIQEILIKNNHDEKESFYDYFRLINEYKTIRMIKVESFILSSEEVKRLEEFQKKEEKIMNGINWDIIPKEGVSLIVYTLSSNEEFVWGLQACHQNYFFTNGRYQKMFFEDRKLLERAMAKCHFDFS